MVSERRYNQVSMLFHWAVAGLILLLLILGWVSEDMARSPAKIQLFFWHKSLGITVLALVALRLAWRFIKPPPALPDSLSSHEKKMAHWGHLALYGFMFLMPLSGWLVQSTSKYPFEVFGLFALPSFTPQTRDWHEFAESLHWLISWALVAVVVVHALAAVAHHLRGHKEVLPAMRPPAWLGLLLGAGLLVLAAFVFISIRAQSHIEQPAQQASASEQSIDAAEAAAAQPNATSPVPPPLGSPRWLMSANSSLAFSAAYDGIGFEGEFTRFGAELAFDPDRLNAGLLKVTIDTASAFTDEQDRDMALRGSEWFNVAAYPKAYYVARRFERLDEHRFRAYGVLTVRGISKSVPLEFDWVNHAEGEAQMIYRASVSRLDFSVGTGEWQSDIISHDVSVSGTLQLIQLAAQ